MNLKTFHNALGTVINILSWMRVNGLANGREAINARQHLIIITLK